jgi:hypothetical protein
MVELASTDSAMIGENSLYYDLDHLMNRNGAFLDPDMFAPSPDVSLIKLSK